MDGTIWASGVWGAGVWATGVWQESGAAAEYWGGWGGRLGLRGRGRGRT